MVSFTVNLKEENQKALEKLKDKYKGKRLFILGTGPSISTVNFELLEDEYLFGVNKLYLIYQDFDINCQFYGISHPTEEYLPNLLALDTELFIGHGALDIFLKKFTNSSFNRLPYLLPLRGWMWKNQNNFSKDITKGTFNGWTVICDISLQVAYYMGFEEVYLLGCDFDFSNQSHFYDNKKNLCDPYFYRRSLVSYKICKSVYEEDGREIINITPDSKLDVFEKSILEEII